MEARDRAAALDLLAQTNNFIPAEIDMAAELIDAVLTRPDQRDYHAFVFADASDGAVGLLIVGPVPATVGAWNMYWIAAHPAQYGTGVGALLAEFAESFVRERGGYLIMVETSSLPSYARTRAFYAKHGYAQVAHVVDYYRPGDDLVLLAKRLA